MRRAQWIEWTRTTLRPAEREALLTTLTPDQKAHLQAHDYVWVARAGVLWTAEDGDLRRARFTHGSYFRTRHGEHFIDSEGHARKLADPQGTKQEEAA